MPERLWGVAQVTKDLVLVKTRLLMGKPAWVRIPLLSALCVFLHVLRVGHDAILVGVYDK